MAMVGLKGFLAAFLLLSVLVPISANASPVTFDVTWSDGNTAQATGTITFSDASIFTTGGSCIGQSLATCNITAMTITVSGAVNGNGTFNESDFLDAYISVGGPLNINTNMVGQTVGVNTWDAAGSGVSNNFNFRNTGSSSAPRRASPFVWATDGGNGQQLTLTSMIAQVTPSAIPSLSEWSQMLLGLLVMTLLGWHFHKQRSY